MPISLSVRRIPLALAGVLAMLGALAGTADAEYGEVGKVVETGKVNESVASPHVFGVDPTDNSFYVGDEVTESGKTFYRIQKFSSGGGQPLAEARIKAIAPSTALGASALEGIAIDSSAKRLYMLVNRKRELEESEPDFETPAAATLYAFSTEVKNSEHKLEPVSNEKPEGALADLNPLSKKARVPLFHPHGIAVNLSNGDVVIVGQEDMQKTEGGEPELHAAVQIVHSNGKPGPRYIDVVNCLDAGEKGSGPELEPACAEGPTGEEAQPFSPIVSPGGKVYVERHGEIWAIPSSTTEVEHEHERFETHPKRLLATEQQVELGPEQTLLEFPKAAERLAEEVGGTMSFVPEGASGEGKIYLTGAIATNAGELILSYAEPGGGEVKAKELGWTGGQGESAGTQCVLTKLGNEALLVVGSKSEDSFVLDAHEEIGAHPKGVDIHEFGPGGSGCPHAGAPSAPSVKVKNSQGNEVEVLPVPLGEAATLSSPLTGANAKSVKWKFKNLTTGKEETKDAAEETEAESYQFLTTSLKHKFEETGEYEVTETVETDDLASPEVKVTRNVKVGATPLAVEFSYPASATVGRATKLEATVTDPHETGTPHLKYTWKFGDGEEKAGEAKATAFNEEHTYHGEGQESVTLKVTDGHGVSGEVTHTISVVKEEEHKVEEEHKTEEHHEEHKSEPPKEEHKGEAPKAEGPPEATLATTLLSATSAGAVTLEVGCPSGESSCSGTVTLRTLNAVAARVVGQRSKKGKHKAVLTLATGSFTVAGGQTQAVTLHLSPAARALLTRLRALRVQATVVARNPAGATHTTQTTVTLRVAKSKRRHKH